MVREINTFISKRINSRKETIEDTSDGPVFRAFGVLLSIRDLRHQTHYILQNEHLHRLALNDDTTGRAGVSGVGKQYGNLCGNFEFLGCCWVVSGVGKQREATRKHVEN